jgi:hypothetical protein
MQVALLLLRGKFMGYCLLNWDHEFMIAAFHFEALFLNNRPT